MAQHPAGIEPMTSRVLLHRCVLNHCTTIASQCFSGKNSDDFGIHNQVFRMKPLRNVYNATSTTKKQNKVQPRGRREAAVIALRRVGRQRPRHGRQRSGFVGVAVDDVGVVCVDVRLLEEKRPNKYLSHWNSERRNHRKTARRSWSELKEFEFELQMQPN